jgi:hypothetical protein
MEATGAQRVACTGGGNGCARRAANQGARYFGRTLQIMLGDSNRHGGECMLGCKQDMVSKAAAFLFARIVRAGNAVSVG